MKQIFILLSFLTISNTSLAQITSAGSGDWSNTATWVGGRASGTAYASAGSGNWTNPATWNPSGVPADFDDVTITAGHTVTVDDWSLSKSLTVNGTLQGSNISRGLVVLGDVLVNITGTIQASGAFATGFANQDLEPWGNLTINGTFTTTVSGSTSDIRTITVRMHGSNKAIGASGTISIPYLYIYATTTLNIAVSGCNDLGLVSGNLDNSTANITMTGAGSLYRYDGTMSVAPVWAGNRNVSYYNDTSPITSAIELPSSVYYFTMNGGGGVTLDKSITVTGSLDMSNGILTTSNTNLLTVGSSATIYGGSSSSFVNGPVAQTWASSTAMKKFLTGKESAYRPLDITLSSPSSPVVRAEVFNSNCGGNKGTLNAISTVRYYQTALTSGSATNGGTLKITFDADDGVSNNTSLVVAQSTTVNGAYTSLGRSASTATTVTSDGTDSPYNPASGDFLVIGSTSGNPLPVELTSFTACVAGKNVSLQWNTATEANNYGFEVERSVISHQ